MSCRYRRQRLMQASRVVRCHTTFVCFVAALLPGNDLTGEVRIVIPAPNPTITQLRMGHSHLALLGQLACSGLECHSQQAARRWASSAAKASGLCVSRLSTTSTIPTAGAAAWRDHACSPRCNAHLVPPAPGVDSSLAPLCRLYSSSCRNRTITRAGRRQYSARLPDHGAPPSRSDRDPG